jgi:hypothetical protein
LEQITKSSRIIDCFYVGCPIEKKPPLKWKKPFDGIFSGGVEQEKLVTALLELIITIAIIPGRVNRPGINECVVSVRRKGIP